MSDQPQPRVTSRFTRESSADDVLHGIDLNGRTALVTGAAGEIGRETARALAGAGARVVLADIDLPKAAAAAADIVATTGNRAVRAAYLDLASLGAVRRFAATFLAEGGALDILVNNAAVMACPLRYSADGYEMQFAVNYLGHWLLACELLPAMERSAAARFVQVSSIAHRRADIDFDDIDFRRRPYDRWVAYGQSKTACALLAIAWTARLGARGITCNALNPGGSMTGLHRHLSQEDMRALGWLDADGRAPARWRTPSQCAATSVWAATAPELAGIGGLYLEECQEALPWSAVQPMAGVLPHARSVPNAHRLWDLSEAMARG
ncbi:MAG: SDR family NAD(P)-dependent oxidoreductase [Alphaproteobacteria bacterium]|nr:SDR family NAD(P)-dependent oxidoreductase [Alphaproteobacteria bacterium]